MVSALGLAKFSCSFPANKQPRFDTRTQACRKCQLASSSSCALPLAYRHARARLLRAPRHRPSALPALSRRCAPQIFSRTGQCLLYKECSRPALPRQGEANEQKLLFGYLFSLKDLVKKMSPKKGGSFYACSTNAFKLNYYETASGLRFVMTTDLAAGDMREPLRKIYADFFVETLVKNPLWKNDEEITCPVFTQQLDQYLRTL